MRISDRSSDVYSSDLLGTGEAYLLDEGHEHPAEQRAPRGLRGEVGVQGVACEEQLRPLPVEVLVDEAANRYERGAGQLAEPAWTGRRHHSDAVAQRREGLEQRTHEVVRDALPVAKSEEHTTELQSLMRISYAVFCLKKKT